VDRTIVGPSGRFNFTASNGEYDVRLLTPSGEILKTERVHVGGPGSSVDLRASVPSEATPVTGTISLARLRHQVNSKAKKEYSKGVQAGERGDNDAAILHFRKAVALDPEFMEAHHDLACKYMRSGQEALAIPEFQKAIELDPSSAQAYANLSIVYLRMGRVEDGDIAAKRAYALDRSAPLSHYVMGMARLAERRFDAETLQHLEAARQQYPYVDRPAAALRNALTKSLVRQ
jgi:Flp pilus assembly protein TadD